MRKFIRICTLIACASSFILFSLVLIGGNESNIIRQLAFLMLTVQSFFLLINMPEDQKITKLRKVLAICCIIIVIVMVLLLLLIQ